MARRQNWTLVVQRDDDPSHDFRISREVIRLMIAIMLLLVAAVSSAVTGFTLVDSPEAETNRLLRTELTTLHQRLDTLRSSLDSLSRQDDAFRLIAGLEPMDVDVRQVGIGAPEVGAAPTGVLPVQQVARLRTAEAASEINRLQRRARLLSFSWREAEDSLRDWNARMEAMPSILPATGYVSSGFSGSRWHPILDRPRPHNGLDIVAPYGSPVVASARGRVRRAGDANEFGLMVEIDHGHGLVTRYAHLSRILVRRGQLVDRADPVGRIGRSGLAAGPHLHYEVLVNGRAANPRRYILDLNVVPD